MEIIRRIFRPHKEAALNFIDELEEDRARFMRERQMGRVYRFLRGSLWKNRLGFPPYVTRNEDQTITVYRRPMEPDILLTPEGNLLRKGHPEPLGGTDYIRTAEQLLSDAKILFSKKG